MIMIDFEQYTYTYRAIVSRTPFLLRWRLSMPSPNLRTTISLIQAIISTGTERRLASPYPRRPGGDLPK